MLIPKMTKIGLFGGLAAIVLSTIAGLTFLAVLGAIFAVFGLAFSVWKTDQYLWGVWANWWAIKGDPGPMDTAPLYITRRGVLTVLLFAGVGALMALFHVVIPGFPWSEHLWVFSVGMSLLAMVLSWVKHGSDSHPYWQSIRRINLDMIRRRGRDGLGKRLP